MSEGKGSGLPPGPFGVSAVGTNFLFAYWSLATMEIKIPVQNDLADCIMSGGFTFAVFLTA
jgi:hypothetical protein